MAYRTPAPLRTVGALVRALLGLALLGVLLAGTPYVLLLVGTQPTDLSGGIDVLLRPDDGTLFFTAITCIGWVAWAAFTWTVVLEIVAVARRRSAPRLRGLSGMQSLASFLVGGIVLLAPTAASAATASPAVAATATQTAGAGTSSPSAAPSPSSAADGWPTHTVTSPTELPWDLAEEYLGNGQRWQDIAALNPGIPGLASGDQYLPKDAVIKLPADARPTTPSAGSTTPAATDNTRETPSRQGKTDTDSNAQTDHGGSNGQDKPAHRDPVTVHTGDSLWSIADEYGDPTDWPEIYEANKGELQPDGRRFNDPDLIVPGQKLDLPQSGSHAEAPPEPDTDDHQDTSPPPNKPADEAPDRSTPTGGDDQDHDRGDEPGSQETTPPAPQGPGGEETPGEGAGNEAPVPSHTSAPAPQSSAPSAPASRPAEQPGQDQGSPSASASARPGPSASVSPSAASPSPSASGESSGSAASSPAATASESPGTAPSSSTLNLRTVLGAGALLAAAVTSALALRRTLQRRRRKPGEKIAIGSETSTAEAQLAVAAEPGGAARLDVALRTLAHRLAQAEDAVLPPLRAARIGARALEVLPEDLSQKPQAPFVSGKAGWWVLPSDAALLNEEPAREVPAPYPGLVTIGSTEAGDLLLLNLTQLPALLLDGNPVHITEVCTSLALELGMSPWASEVEVITVGFGEELPQLLPTARIAHMRQAAHALRDLSERLLEAHQMPETQHQPYLLLCASSLDADTAWQFADVIDRSGPVPVTLIAPASSAASNFPEAEILNATLSEPQRLDYAGIDVSVQRLDHASYLQIATALHVSGQPAHPAEGAWQEVPDEPDSPDQPGPGTPQRSAASATVASTSGSGTPAAEVSGEIFPALLAATDPSAHRIRHAATAVAQAEGERVGPGTTMNPAPPPAVSAESGEADSEGAEEGALAEGKAQGRHAPEIRVLGPVEVTGVDSTGHGPRMAQLAALLHFRPGRSADILCSDMDPVSPWSSSTLNARLQGLRRTLGNDPDGAPYVPRRKSAEDPYRLSRAVRCDWTDFLHLVERALPLGPAGLPDLERALTLVRGRPFGGRPLPWAEPHQQEMITRIIDVAHTVATHRTPAGPHRNLSAARQAVATGLDVDDTAELLYRDWARIEHAAGNRQGLHTAIARVQQVNSALDCSLETATEQLINELLGTTRDDQAQGAVSVPHATASGPSGHKGPVRRPGVSGESPDAQS
ncbi:LysM peptidoglycan-binding domain-containing protein [Streptomyces umbrinus]|uniref:LysM peptidoglycan-binding domain-containing protein n=1 Tax=Streptomyces umbrinus TaxID=67370 RepID=UPI003C3036C1